MSRWSRTLALVLALAVMPLQGIAATLSALYCHGDARAHAMHEPGSHDHGQDTHRDAQHGGTHGSQQDDGGAVSFHLCCNLTASTPPTASLPEAPPDFSVRAFDPDSFHDLFIPDRPQRPPLA